MDKGGHKTGRNKLGAPICHAMFFCLWQRCGGQKIDKNWAQHIGRRKPSKDGPPICCGVLSFGRWEVSVQFLLLLLPSSSVPRSSLLFPSFFLLPGERKEKKRKGRSGKPKRDEEERKTESLERRRAPTFLERLMTKTERQNLNKKHERQGPPKVLRGDVAW